MMVDSGKIKRWRYCFLKSTIILFIVITAGNSFAECTISFKNNNVLKAHDCWIKGDQLFYSKPGGTIGVSLGTVSSFENIKPKKVEKPTSVNKKSRSRQTLLPKRQLVRRTYQPIKRQSTFKVGNINDPYKVFEKALAEFIATWLLFAMIIAIFPGLLGAWLAARKGRSSIGWFVLCAIMPLSVFVLICLGPAGVVRGVYKKCPNCKEIIKWDALVCKYCNNKAVFNGSSKELGF